MDSVGAVRGNSQAALKMCHIRLHGRNIAAQRSKGTDAPQQRTKQHRYAESIGLIEPVRWERSNSQGEIVGSTFDSGIVVGVAGKPGTLEWAFGPKTSRSQTAGGNRSSVSVARKWLPA